MEEKKRQGRRDFLKFVTLGAASVIGYKGIDWLAKKKESLGNPKTREQFLGGEELFPGYSSYFNGTVFVREGAVIHSEPRVWIRQPEKGTITTNVREETDMYHVGKGEEFSIRNPYLVLREAKAGDENVSIVRAPDTTVKKVDMNAVWVVFPATGNMPDVIKADIKRSLFKVGCISVRGYQMGFRPSGSSESSLSFESSAIAFAQDTSFSSKDK